MPNSWRIVISYMVIWMIIVDGDMITLNEFILLYHLKESKEFCYYELVPWDRRSRLIVNLPSSFRYWKFRYFFVSVGRPFLMTSGGMSLGCCIDGRHLNLVHLPCIFFFFFLVYLFTLIIPSDLVCVFFYFIVKDHPELESRFEERVRAAVKYVSTIDDFDDLVDPRTLARHCLGPKPSHYVLRAILRKEKSESL